MTDPASGSDDSLPPEWLPPDDARELDVDLEALRAEERAAASRRRRPGQVLRQYGTPGFIVVLALIGVAAVAAALVVGAPVGLPTDSAARPLAAPTGSPGTPGALLPEVTVLVGREDRPARRLRPAVLVVLPQPCGCAAALGGLAAEVGQYALPLVLITAAENPEIPALLRAARATRTYPAVDPAAALARAYDARGLTVLLVRADGVVTTVQRQLPPGHRFGAALSDLDA